MIHIDAPAGPLPVDPALMKRAALAALTQQSAKGDLSIVLANDEQLQGLNRNYLGIDAPTDVLSFPASETDPQSGSTYLGDILISMQRATKQAEDGGHPLEAEVQLLVVHGVLHLLGHDHGDPAEKSRMWEAQSAILQSLGLANIEIRET